MNGAASSTTERRLGDSLEAVLASRKGRAGLPRFQILFREVVCRQGVPDFIAGLGLGRKRRDLRRFVAATRIGAESSLSVLALLQVRRFRSEEYLARATGLSESGLRRVLARLILAGLVVRKANGNRRYRLSRAAQAPTTELWAFEIKVKDWRRALYQGLQYRAFAHRVVIVFPVARERLLRRHVARFRRWGIGVAVFDEREDTIRVLCRPIRRRPTSRSHHLFAFSQIAALSLGLPVAALPGGGRFGGESPLRSVRQEIAVGE